MCTCFVQLHSCGYPIESTSTPTTTATPMKRGDDDDNNDAIAIAISVGVVVGIIVVGVIIAIIISTIYHHRRRDTYEANNKQNTNRPGTLHMLSPSQEHRALMIDTATAFTPSDRQLSTNGVPQHVYDSPRPINGSPAVGANNGNIDDFGPEAGDEDIEDVKSIETIDV